MHGLPAWEVDVRKELSFHGRDPELDGFELCFDDENEHAPALARRLLPCHAAALGAPLSTTIHVKVTVLDLWKGYTQSDLPIGEDKDYVRDPFDFIRAQDPLRGPRFGKNMVQFHPRTLYRYRGPVGIHNAESPVPLVCQEKRGLYRLGESQYDFYISRSSSDSTRTEISR